MEVSKKKVADQNNGMIGRHTLKHEMEQEEEEPQQERGEEI